MKIAVFGPTLLSSLRNPHASTIRGILGALHARGHSIHYYEAEALDEHRDLEHPPWGTQTHYTATPEAALRAVESASDADLLIKASRTGPCGALITEAILDLQHPGCEVIFWDTDPATTLSTIHQNPTSPLHRLIPRFTRVLTNAGGETTIAIYRSLGAHQCTVLYPAITPTAHPPIAAEARFRCDLTLHSDRLPCDEAKVHEFLLNQVDQFPERRFLLSGSGWDDLPEKPNLEFIGHLPPDEQNCLNASALAVLSLSRSNAERSPSHRLFEAAGAGACLLTDEWTGIEDFFEPEREIIVVHPGEELPLENLEPERAKAIGQAARRRALKDHTYAQRAIQFEALF